MNSCSDVSYFNIFYRLNAVFSIALNFQDIIREFYFVYYVLQIYLVKCNKTNNNHKLMATIETQFFMSTVLRIRGIVLSEHIAID